MDLLPLKRILDAGCEIELLGRKWIVKPLRLRDIAEIDRIVRDWRIRSLIQVREHIDPKTYESMLRDALWSGPESVDLACMLWLPEARMHYLKAALRDTPDMPEITEDMADAMFADVFAASTRLSTPGPGDNNENPH